MLLVLDSTIDTISSLIENYKQFRLDIDNSPMDTNSEEFDPIAFALREKHREVMFSRKKAETLQIKVQGMSTLVSKHLGLDGVFQILIWLLFSPQASLILETVNHSSS